MSAPVPRPSGPFVAPGSVRIFDTTLRDGEQAPGAGLTAAEKLEVARQLARLKVDVIEAGFPAASPGDFEAVRRIAEETPQDIAVAALARCKDGDPQRAIEAIKVAHKPHLHVFIATSDIHLKHKLRVDRGTALAEAVRWVRHGREQLGRDAEIEFSAEDASRTDIDYLLQVYEAVVEAGASTVNIPDTVGYAIPSEFGALTKRVVDLVGGAATVSIHCHNDLGLATANTLAAVQAGARQVEVTINGLGERAGNASLEEVVMALRTRPTQFPDLGSGVQTEHITAASRLVSYLTGFAVQPNKAIVGGNAFAHESGIHQDGVIKNPLTYEIMTPQSVGLSGSQLTIGKLSGRRGLQGKLRELGHELDGDVLDAIYRQAIELADAKKEVTDADLLALVEQRASEVEASVVLVGWNVTSSHGGNAVGTVTLSVNGDGTECRGDRERPGQRALQGRRRHAPAAPRLAPDADRVRDQGRVGRRGRAGPGTGPLPPLVGRGTRRARRVRPRVIHEHHRGVARRLSRRDQQAPWRRDQRGRRGIREPAGRRGPAMTEADLQTYRIATIPGDGVGPEVVEAARRVVEAAGGGSDSGRLAGDPRRWHRDRHLRCRDPPRGCRGVRRGGRDPARRRGRAEMVRPRRAFAPSRPCSPCVAASACSRTCARSRSTRPSWRPPRPRRAARRGRPAHRPRADRRLYFGEREEPRARPANGGARHDAVPEDEISRIVRLAFELARGRRAG